MNEIKTSKIRINPEFDLEEFMNFSHETRMESETLERISSYWEEWANLLQAMRIEKGKKSWISIWMPEEVENIIDDLWEKSPSAGFMLNNLAQYLCMRAVSDLLPQVAQGGCAPAPEMVEPLEKALGENGLLHENGHDLKRRYAILSYYPFRGGCEICSLAESCPKGRGEDVSASVTLPGYERGLG